MTEFRTSRTYLATCVLLASVETSSGQSPDSQGRPSNTEDSIRHSVEQALSRRDVQDNPALWDSLRAAAQTTDALLADLVSRAETDVRLAAVVHVARELGVELPLMTEALAGRYHDPSWRVRRAALRAMRHLGSAEDVETIFPLLEDDDGRVCECAGETLGLLADVKSIGKLRATMTRRLSVVPAELRDTDPTVRACRRAIQNITDGAPTLWRSLRSGTVTDIDKAARLLKKAQTPYVAQAIVFKAYRLPGDKRPLADQLLQIARSSPSHEMRMDAFEFLRDFGDGRDRGALLELAERGEAGALLPLGRLGDSKTADRLREIAAARARTMTPEEAREDPFLVFARGAIEAIEARNDQ